jgi:hypothetical protein
VLFANTIAMCTDNAKQQNKKTAAAAGGARAPDVHPRTRYRRGAAESGCAAASAFKAFLALGLITSHVYERGLRENCLGDWRREAKMQGACHHPQACNI